MHKVAEELNSPREYNFISYQPRQINYQPIAFTKDLKLFKYLFTESQIFPAFLSVLSLRRLEGGRGKGVGKSISESDGAER